MHVRLPYKFSINTNPSSLYYLLYFLARTQAQIAKYLIQPLAILFRHNILTPHLYPANASQVDTHFSNYTLHPCPSQAENRLLLPNAIL
ncbi:hypothetical protein SDC9_151297 [bioreactor metagenome]|uniref:Uncharacterized protein n=1 Tax=bioreactor metagenome TaxID=1076179 RepID=A0A645EPV9_9ZZZZ